MKANPMLGVEPVQPSIEDDERLIDAAKHIAHAKHSLTCLRSEVCIGGRHPEIDNAIRHVEIALNILTAGTGGLL